MSVREICVCTETERRVGRPFQGCPAHNAVTAPDALLAAWLDDDRAEAYADLDVTGQAVRDAARVVINADPIKAFGALLAFLDEDGLLDGARELLSWIEAPEVWR